MDGKLVVTTGGDTGLGLESTKRPAGAMVVFTSRDKAKERTALSEVLEDKFESILSKPKTGFRSHCFDTKRVNEIKVCGQCKGRQCCSPQCQSLAWPDYKAECKPMGGDQRS